MANIQFTDKAIRALRLPPEKNSVTFSQPGIKGLQLRVFWLSGALRDPLRADIDSFRYQWLLRFHLAGSEKPRGLVSLGSWPAVKPPEAIREALYYQEQAKLGIDPRVAKLEDKAVRLQSADVISNAPARYRIEVVLERFKKYWPSTGRDPGTMEKYEAAIESYLLNQHRGMDIRMITANRWEKIILKVANLEHKKGAANNLHKAGRRLLSFAVKEELITANPLLGMTDVLQQIRLDPNTRYLESDEIHTLLTELDDQQIAAWAKVQLLVMLRAGGRVSEWGRVRISWINFKYRRIEIPKQAMKNRRAAWVHLPDVVIDLLISWLQDLKSEHGQLDESWFLFGSAADPAVANPYDLSFETQKLAGWIKFTPKALRKTISTQLQRKSCPPAVLRAIRNQVIAQGVEAHYDFDDLFHLKKEWIEKWNVMLGEVEKDPAALVPDKESRLSSEYSEKVEELFS